MPLAPAPSPGFARALVAAVAPRGLSSIAKYSFGVELITTLFFSVALAPVEGGVIGVYCKQTFTDAVAPTTLHVAVALVATASELANIVSFIWVALAHGHRKVPLINAMQLIVLFCVGLIAAAPRTGTGLALVATLALGARLAWSGIITTRPTIWRANFPRHLRAHVVGRFAIIQQVTVAGVGVALGALLDLHHPATRLVFPCLAVVAIPAYFATHRQLVRGERAMLTGERAEPDIGRPWQGPGIVWRVLRRDRFYFNFMIAMFVMGFGNLMINPVLIVVLKDDFGAGYFRSILLITVIPNVLMPLSVPMWAAMLDRAHVVRFRSVHGWTFVISTLTYLVAVFLHMPALLVIGAVVQGVALGGGSLAWNLGHVDFSPPAQTSQYMATHVTLNGVRGLLSPIVAIGIYDLLSRTGWSSSHAGTWVLGVSCLLCALGAGMFVALRVSMGPAAAISQRRAA